jgi:hypothetical protein
MLSEIFPWRAKSTSAAAASGFAAATCASICSPNSTHRYLVLPPGPAINAGTPSRPAGQAIVIVVPLRRGLFEGRTVSSRNLQWWNSGATSPGHFPAACSSLFHCAAFPAATPGPVARVCVMSATPPERSGLRVCASCSTSGFPISARHSRVRSAMKRAGANGIVVKSTS